MKAAVIVNSIAARRNARDFKDAVKTLTCSKNIHYELFTTRDEGDAVGLSRDAVKSGFDIVVAAGGDGTVNECVNGLLSTNTRSNIPALGVIPLGSGCDFIRSVGIPRNPEKAARLLDAIRTIRVDVGRVVFRGVNGLQAERFFINVADVGAGGIVVKHAASAPRLFGKRPNYLWGMLAAVTSYSPKIVSIRFDSSEPKRVRVRNVVFANGRYFGRGFKVAPLAEIDDKLLDVVILGDYSTMESIWHLPRMFAGTHLSLKKIEHYRARKIELNSEEEILLELDGELAGTLPAVVDILPAAIPLIV